MDTADSDCQDGLYRPVFVTSWWGDKRFCSPWNPWKIPSMKDLMKWKLKEKDESNVPSPEELKKTLPILPINYGKLQQPTSPGIQVMWIGHASLIVQFDGMTVITDPMFSKISGPKYASTPYVGSLLGYRRFLPPACTISQLKENHVEIDAAIISHDHFDHLDESSVEALNTNYPDIKWIVPAGLKIWCTDHGCQQESVTELSWWESYKLPTRNQSGEMEFISTPCQHWCRRGVSDQNKTLWCSWVLRGPTKRFFFAGDTGYYKPCFQQIGDKYGPFNLAAIPIGAYAPRYITKYQHVDPGEAVKIHQDVKAEQSFGIHWGSFVMTNEFYLEPREKLAEEVKKQGVAEGSFITLNHGEVWAVGELRDEAENPESRGGLGGRGAKGEAENPESRGGLGGRGAQREAENPESLGGLGGRGAKGGAENPESQGGPGGWGAQREAENPESRGGLGGWGAQDEH